MGVLESIIPVGIIILVLVILNVIFLAIIFFTQRKVNAINEWPTTTGKVLTSQTEWRSSGEGSAEYPVVLYSYRANGQEFQGRRIAPGMEVGGIGARKVVERYPVNSQVTVYYNPENPEDAVLEKKAGSQVLMWVLLVIFDCALCGSIPLIVWATSSS
jgi:hypothetical protein